MSKHLHLHIKNYVQYMIMLYVDAFEISNRPNVNADRIKLLFSAFAHGTVVPFNSRTVAIDDQKNY